ncbi:unnamed protein product, partial [Echinostoma caproni]|uniref:ZM domain-containing protein n=1 Tax=Echinostoma caproni TaxID=27848 RepID=A0A183A4V2_9TREM
MKSPDRTSEPSLVLAAPQIPMYGQHEKSDEMKEDKPLITGVNQYSPSVVNTAENENTEPVPGVTSVLVAPSENERLLDVPPSVEIIPSADKVSSVPEPFHKRSDYHMTALQSFSDPQVAPDLNRSPRVSARQSEHFPKPSQAKQDQLSVRVAQNAIPTNHDEGEQKVPRLDYAPNMLDLPRSDEAEIHKIPQGPPFHTSVQSQLQLIDPGRSPAVEGDLDKNQLRAPAVTNVMSQPIAVAEPSQGDMVLPMHYVVPSVPVPDQLSNFAVSSKDVLQTGREIRNEKIPTNVERITRAPAPKMEDAI